MAVIDSDVKAVITTTRDTTPFIATAQLLVDEVLASANLSTARKDKITLYLAAHFVFISESEGEVSAEKGDMKEQYRSSGDKSTGFATTMYGKTALALDTSGLLVAAAANDGLKARFKVYAQNQCIPVYAWW